MKICFVDTTKLEYSFKDLYNKNIRGSESSVINLSTNVSKLVLSKVSFSLTSLVKIKYQILKF